MPLYRLSRIRGIREFGNSATRRAPVRPAGRWDRCRPNYTQLALGRWPPAPFDRRPTPRTASPPALFPPTDQDFPPYHNSTTTFHIKRFRTRSHAWPLTHIHFDLPVSFLHLHSISLPFLLFNYHKSSDFFFMLKFISF